MSIECARHQIVDEAAAEDQPDEEHASQQKRLDSGIADRKDMRGEPERGRFALEAAVDCITAVCV